jgi:hypothetical protein
MSRLVLKGILEPTSKITLDGVDYYASHSISPNYKIKKNSLHTELEMRRMFARLEESSRSIVFKGITYYAIDLEDRGW